MTYLTRQNIRQEEVRELTSHVAKKKEIEKIPALANTVGAHCYTTLVCVCALNGGMKFVPLIRAGGCATAQSFQCPAADLPAFTAAAAGGGEGSWLRTTGPVSTTHTHTHAPLPGKTLGQTLRRRPLWLAWPKFSRELAIVCPAVILGCVPALRVSRSLHMAEFTTAGLEVNAAQVPFLCKLMHRSKALTLSALAV